MSAPPRFDPALAGLLAPYAAPAEDAPWDEAIGPDGAPRAHWAPLLDWVARVGPEGYGAVTAETRRLRVESGVAFNPAGEETPDADTDAFPILIEPAEWARVAQGVAQRARLLEAALDDIYGDRTLLREGLLPSGLVYGNPDHAMWLRTPDAPAGPWLTLYEMDIARTSDGRWMALADRVDAPLGDGWLIANRVASSQSFAEPFLTSRVRRLARHYEAAQTWLEDLSGPDGRMALLSGGGQDPRYFSHAYFARYVGAALIEPADLTVRGGDAYVKTIDGLKPLSVLLRGVSDRRLDALFAPDGAAPGAPALSLAARAGRLRLANALGASTLAYRALAPFARASARRLFGEELFL
ncbi:MAG: circularly permuted type 2 ATP-grasp protein, partial [Pseudomonadota bacterium]